MESYITYNVGGYDLAFPSDHMMPRYQEKWRRYDTALAYIGQIVFSKYPGSSAIDIGANVGDSAALIQQYQKVPTLCIEGNPEFIQYLEHNASVIENIEIEDSFLGKDGEKISLEHMRSEGGTASVTNAVEKDGFFVSYAKSLESILDHRPFFNKSKLLKIDTDGFDFLIIQASHEFIRKSQPVIFFEYDITFSQSGILEAKEAIELLIRVGYKRFIFYDNFGNYCMSFSDSQLEILEDLNRFLFSNRFLSGTPSIYYYDVCAFSQEDEELFTAVRVLESEATDQWLKAQ